MHRDGSSIGRTTRGTAAVLCLLLLGAACGLATAQRKVKPHEGRRAETREVEQMEQQWRTAIVGGDAVAMEKLLADDFLAISARGTLLDKEQYLARISTKATKLSAVDLMDLKVRVQPGAAVTVSQAHIAGMLEGRPIEGVFRYTKVFTRQPGGTWRMTNFEATRVPHSAGTNDADQAMPSGERLDPSPAEK